MEPGPEAESGGSRIMMPDTSRMNAAAAGAGVHAGASTRQMVRVVAVSDTHGLHDALGPLPPGDILIHCGDFTDKGSAAEVASFNRWLGEQPHAVKLVVAVAVGEAVI